MNRIVKQPKNAKEVPKFLGYYITESGQLWSGPKPNCHKASILLRPAKNNHGHLYVYLWRDKKSYKQYIHRLVLETFIGPCPAGLECRHLDGNPENNKLNNLKWGTKMENQKDRLLHGTDRRGERHGAAKLNNLQVRVIKHLLDFKTLSQKEIGSIFNVSRNTIASISCKKSWNCI